MAVWVFKKEGEEVKSDLIKPEYLASALSAGWSLEESGEADSVKKEESKSSDSVRQEAKEAGIEGWDTKRIKTLEAELCQTQK